MERIKAGVDISAWNRDVDFKKLKNGTLKDYPIDFVMIRLSVDKSVDVRAVSNINAALNAGLDVGVYHYSYAKNPEDAKAEAKLVLKTIKDNNMHGKLTMPIAFDFEENEVFRLGRNACTEICTAFMDEIAAADYQPMLCTFAAAYNNFINKEKLKKYPLWIAGYVSEKVLNNTFGIKEYAMWQFGVAGNPEYDIEVIGSVSGVKGQCDCDYLYEDLPAKIKAEGKNGFSAEDKDNTDNDESNIYTLTVGNIPSKQKAKELLDYAKGMGLEGSLTVSPADNSAADDCIEKIALEVIRGDWGVNPERKKRLTEAGYNYEIIQKKVNELINQR